MAGSCPVRDFVARETGNIGARFHILESIGLQIGVRSRRSGILPGVGIISTGIASSSSLANCS